MLIAMLLGTGNSLALSKKFKTSTQQASGNCFSPQNGVFQGGPWSNQGAQQIQNTLTFQAYGNDIYVGFSNSANSQSFNYAFIICGWGNTQIHLYNGNSFGTAIASSNWTLDANALNSFEIDFLPSSGTINLSINGNQVFSFQDPNFQNGAYNYVQFSQYSSNVVICSGCFDPQNGVFGGGAWADNGIQFNGILNFSALGNDIYVGFFPSESNSSSNSAFLYAFIIAGWSDTYVNLYNGGAFGNSIASAPLTVDPTQENSYQIVFDNKAGSLQLTVNGNVIINYTDPSYNGSQANWANFSQYSSNVAICAPTTAKGPGRCGH